MKRDVSIHAVENGWMVAERGEAAFYIGVMGKTWVFNSTADLCRDLPAILETESGPKPEVTPPLLNGCDCPSCMGARDAKMAHPMGIPAP